MLRTIVSIDEKENTKGKYLDFEIDGESCIMYYSPNSKSFVFENKAINLKTEFTDEQMLQVLKNSFCAETK